MEPKEQYTSDWSKLYNGAIEHSIDPLTGTHTTTGLWSQITDSNTLKSPYYKLEERLDKLELDNKLLRLKILALEGKFAQDEISNIRKMLMSQDQASITLADSIIENA